MRLMTWVNWTTRWSFTFRAIMARVPKAAKTVYSTKWAFFNAVPEDFNEVMKHMDELGGPMTFNHYPIGWAHAMDTPFQWTKQVASHFGGTRNGMVISWPARIKDVGGIRPQFHHVIDIYPRPSLKPLACSRHRCSTVCHRSRSKV